MELAAVDDEELLGLPGTPPEYYRAPQAPRLEHYQSPVGARLQCALSLKTTREHPLWTSHIWSGARALADVLCEQPNLVAGRRVCELGAGAGLVSIIAALAGAAQVVATDYPDPEVIENLEQNIRLHVPKLSRATDLPQPAVKVIHYRWGSSPVLLRQQAGVQSFAVILMADLLSYHQAHPALLQSVKALLALPEDDPAAVALVAFAHHRPHVADRDRAFLDLVNADGALIAEPWLPPVQMEPMFPEDAGAATVRGCVHRWRLRWRPFASGDTSKETHGFNDGASLS